MTTIPRMTTITTMTIPMTITITPTITMTIQITKKTSQELGEEEVNHCLIRKQSSERRNIRK